MNHEDAMKLEPEQKVIHRRYGVCIVIDVMMAQGELFGVVVRPDNQNGRELLRKDCECDVPDFLEDYPELISTENAPAKPGEKPIDLETAWGSTKKDLPLQERRNHFAQDNEGVPE